MSTWRFSDGTVIHLGGEVEGASAFAQEMREMFAQDDLKIHLWALPSRATPLDRNNLTHMQRALFQESRMAGVSIVEKPDNIPPAPPPPWGDKKYGERIGH